MPRGHRDEVELARLLGTLYTEVFQRRVRQDNKPLSQSSHKLDRLTLDEDVFTVLTTATNTTLWGQSGVSHHIPANGIQGVWSEGGSWG